MRIHWFGCSVVQEDKAQDFFTMVSLSRQTGVLVCYETLTMPDWAQNTFHPETLTHTLWMTWRSRGGPKQIPDLIKLTLRFNKHSQVTCVWNVCSETYLETDALLIHKSSHSLSSISVDDKPGSSQKVSNALVSSHEGQRWICEVAHISRPDRFIMTRFAHASVAISLKANTYLLQTRLLNRNQKLLCVFKST